jgi:nucleoid DNA-binding protein
MTNVKRVDLTRDVIAKYDLDKEAAERFVQQMFAVLREGIEREKNVKVKSLGTFKITSVNARESVDVNTGERIVIEGRNKITFTPDVVLRDRVNSPFAQFETVVLNEGVDFSQTESENDTADVTEEMENSSDVDEGVVTNETEKSMPVQSETDAALEKPASTSEASVPVLENTPSAPEKPVAKTEEATSSSHDAVANDMASLNISSLHIANVHIDAMHSAKKTEEAKTDTSSQPQCATTQEETDSQKTQVAAECIERLKNENFALKNENRKLKNSCRRSAILYKRAMWIMGVVSAVAIVLVAAGIWGIYYHLSIEQQNKTQLATLQKDYDLLSNRFRTLVNEKDSQTENVSFMTASASVGSSTPSAAKPSNEEAKKPAVTVKASETKAPAPSTYDADSRVRTGAYQIIGIDKTVTLRQGQSLKSISRAYLGEGMECYVEAVNKGHLSVGDKVNIPKLKLKRKH